MPTQGGNILHTKWPMKIHGKGLLFGVVAYLKKIFLAQWEQSFTRASVRSNLQLIMTKLPTLITFFKKSMEAFTVMLGGFSSFVGLFLAIFHFEFF